MPVPQPDQHPDRDPDWIDLGPLADLPDPGCHGFVVDDLAGLLVRCGPLLRAWRDRCPHIGGPLTWVPTRQRGQDPAATPIRCSLHGAQFLPATGACIDGPCLGKALTALPIEVRDGRVWLAAAALDALDDD